MKVLAFYLPQYHRTKENDEWWGEGYTEWTAVRNARPLFRGHRQPAEPLDDFYYDLSDESGSVWKWQAELAQKYGVYGFCIYHYWLGNGIQLLEKPMEILLNHPEIDINYCVCWANHDWAKTWYEDSGTILCKQEYGDLEEWKKHFEYLVPFFRDSRYIKIDNRPVVNIFNTSAIEEFSSLKNVWNELAREAGFRGIFFVSGNLPEGIDQKNIESIDAFYNFEAGYTYYHIMPAFYKMVDLLLRKIRMNIARIFKKEICGYWVNLKRVYRYILKNKTEYRGKKIFLGVVVRWDNTPRKQTQGMLYRKSSPKLFGKVLRKLNRKVGSDDFVYVNAWNEWGEGCYLEPDKEYRYAYLEAIKNAQE